MSASLKSIVTVELAAQIAGQIKPQTPTQWLQQLQGKPAGFNCICYVPHYNLRRGRDNEKTKQLTLHSNSTRFRR